MRWRDLFEAPISDLQLRGYEDTSFDDKNHLAFSDTDRKLLSSEKGRAKIVRAFQKTPHVFEVVFLNNDWTDGDHGPDNEDVDAKALQVGAGVYDEFEGIAGKPNVITVVMIGNLSPVAEKMPMTGWTLAHKIGHSFQDEIVNRSSWRGPLADRLAQINRMIMMICDLDDGVEYKEHPKPIFKYPDTLHKKLTMKSAPALANSPFEAFAEMIAQYLIMGKVRMKLNNPKDIQPYVNNLNSLLDGLFHSLRGKVLVEI